MRKILVVEPEQILGAAILCLLTKAENLHVFGFTPGTNAELVAKINQLQPDVVIIDQASLFVEAVRPQSVQFRVQFCLMTINSEDNWVKIEHRRPVLITKGADLPNIIHHCPKRPPSKHATNIRKGKAERIANHRSDTFEPHP